ncbi:unnamed protein product [Linum tenue]|uniref:Uncharacterized protein n=1 Tax=Linum tenue TaxID=586396 RepID=A0AAV0LA27_9ROSI|nr:unnamed protein product [Linum tenue]CAI0467884.1 unnamed protein product [Linum tenue]
MAVLAYNESRIDTRKRNIGGYLLFFAGTLMLLVVIADAHVQGGMVGDLSFMCAEFMQVRDTLITKAAFENARHGLRKGVQLFLAIAVFMELLCFLLYAFYVPKLPIVKYYRSKAAKEGSKTVSADLKAAGILTNQLCG